MASLVGRRVCGEVWAEWFFSPVPPLQHRFSWQNYHPLFLLAALLQAVCVKNHHFFFCQAVLTGSWSLNSNCSLIASLPTIQNLPSLLVYFGISRDVNQYIFIITEIMVVLKKNLSWYHVGMHDCGRTWSPIKCNYSLTPFAPNSLSPGNEVAYGLCLEGHRQKDGLAGESVTLTMVYLNQVLCGL